MQNIHRVLLNLAVCGDDTLVQLEPTPMCNSVKERKDNQVYSERAKERAGQKYPFLSRNDVQARVRLVELQRVKLEFLVTAICQFM